MTGANGAIQEDALSEVRKHSAAFLALNEFGLPKYLVPSARLLDITFPPVTYAIEPYFPRGEITELVGAHGIFKSTAALDADLADASGRAWGGVPSSRGRSAFITMEDGERTLSRRVRAWLEGVPPGQERADAEADIRKHFAYLAREQARALALTTTDRNTTTVRPEVVDHIASLVHGCSLVTLETASRLHDGPEMNEALAVFAQAVERIATASGAAVVLVRHVSKAAAREQTIDSYAGRGGGALSDAARSVLVMTRDRPADDDEAADPLAPVRLTHAKATLSRPGPRLVWRPETCEHGVYLRAVSHDEEATTEARKLLEHLRRHPAGVSASELHKTPPAGLGRAATKAALERLIAKGLVRFTEEERGRNRALATVYRAAEGA